MRQQLTFFVIKRNLQNLIFKKSYNHLLFLVIL